MYVTHGKTLPAVSFPLMVIWMTYESFWINEDTAFFLNLLVQLRCFFDIPPRARLQTPLPHAIPSFTVWVLSELLVILFLVFLWRQ